MFLLYSMFWGTDDDDDDKKKENCHRMSVLVETWIPAKIRFVLGINLRQQWLRPCAALPARLMGTLPKLRPARRSTPLK